VHHLYEHCPAEDERDSSGGSEAGPSSPWPSWLSKDDVVTIAIALGISYGIRWCAAAGASSHAVVPASELL
jgi:hypothetical protein